MDWFLYDGDLCHERVNKLHKNTKTPAASVDVILFRLKIYPKIEFFHLFFLCQTLPGGQDSIMEVLQIRETAYDDIGQVS